MTGRFVVGLVGGAFGLEGFVKVKSLSGETGHLLRLRSAVLRLRGGERDVEIEKSVPVFPSVVMKFRGVHTPEEAGKFAGAEIITGRENASPLKPGEYYIEDLKGLEVAADGRVVGHITGVFEGGGGYVAEIRLASGDLKLVPFRDEFFGEIDAEAGRAALRDTWILE
ncbi:MAG: ribosome maturation factor RimM [Treponema sp.]|jgi:16S rRNA processing protein RimM|nr:ribosome maturation factor RimM [Treponema sp.]